MIHAIWLGDRPMLALHERCIATWPEHRIWDAAALESKFGDALDFAPPREASAAACYWSDVYRYMILRRFGGVYLDVDVELLRPLPDWTDAVCWERPANDMIGSAVVFASAGAPWICAVAEGLRSAVADANGRWLSALGPPYLTRTVLGLPSELRPRIMSNRHFFPCMPGLNAPHPESFGIHHWTKSWGTRR